jgi:hypothetical protein
MQRPVAESADLASKLLGWQVGRERGGGYVLLIGFVGWELSIMAISVYSAAGDATLSFNDLVLAAETCEELFTPDAPHIQLALNGVEVCVCVCVYVCMCLHARARACVF